MRKKRAKIPFDPAKFPFFYGYIIFICAAFGMIMSGPGQTIGVAAFTDSLVENLKISRFQLSLAYMIGTIASSFMIGKAGKMLDYYSVRRVVSVSVVGLGLFLFYMAYSDLISDFFGGGVVVAMVVITLGFWMVRFFGQGILSLSSRTMLMRWFDKKRGRANAFLGIAIVVTFSFLPTIYNSIRAIYDWRFVWVLLGIMSIAYAVFVLVFYRDRPEDSGLLPDGITEEEHARDLATASKEDLEEEWEYKEVLRNYTFWIFNISLGMYSLVVTAVTFHIESIFEVAGKSSAEAFGMFKMAAIIGVCLNLAVGFLSDTRKFKHRLNWLLLLMLCGLTLELLGVLLLSTNDNSVTMIVIGHGVAAGVFSVVSSLVWPRYFGRTHLGQISGLAMSFMIFFSAVGPSIFGWSFEFFGEYNAASYIVAAVLVVLALCSLVAKFPHRKLSK